MSLRPGVTLCESCSAWSRHCVRVNETTGNVEAICLNHDNAATFARYVAKAYACDQWTREPQYSDRI